MFWGKEREEVTYLKNLKIYAARTVRCEEGWWEAVSPFRITILGEESSREESGCHCCCWILACVETTLRLVLGFLN